MPLIPSSVFFAQLLYTWAITVFFFFSSSLLKYSCCSSIISPSFISILFYCFEFFIRQISYLLFTRVLIKVLVALVLSTETNSYNFLFFLSFSVSLTLGKAITYSSPWKWFLVWECPYEVCVCPMALVGELDLKWAWTVSSPGVWWQPLHWWDVGLELVGPEPEPGVSKGFPVLNGFHHLIRGSCVAWGAETRVLRKWISPVCDGSFWIILGLWA